MVFSLMWSQCVLQLLSKSIEQLRQPSAHLQESEEEQEEQHRDETESMQEDRLPPGGVIRKHTLSSSSSGSSSELPDAHCGVIKVKEEPADSEDEALTNQSLEAEQSAYLHQVKGRLVIRAMIWEGKKMRSHTCNIRRVSTNIHVPAFDTHNTTQHTHIHTEDPQHSRPALPFTTYDPFSLSCSLVRHVLLRLSVCDHCVVISVKYCTFHWCKYGDNLNRSF